MTEAQYKMLLAALVRIAVALERIADAAEAENLPPV